MGANPQFVLELPPYFSITRGFSFSTFSQTCFDHVFQLIRSEGFEQDWPTAALQKTLGILIYRAAGSEYYPVRTAGVRLLHPFLEIFAAHNRHLDVNQIEVISPLTYHSLSYPAIGSNIHVKPFAGKHSPADISNYSLIFHHQDSLSVCHGGFHLLFLFCGGL